jgi:hypothetical protein
MSYEQIILKLREVVAGSNNSTHFVSFHIGRYYYRLYNNSQRTVLMAAPIDDPDNWVDIWSYSIVTNKITNEDSSYFEAISIAGLLQFIVFN